MNISTFDLYLGTVFISALFAEFWGVPSMIKRLLKINQTKFVEPLDCLPCFSFWISLFTLNPTVIMGTFITFYIIGKMNKQ